MFKKIWDIRWAPDGWQVYCLLHGESSPAGVAPGKNSVDAARAIEHATYLNEQENGPLARGYVTHDIMDNPRSVAEVWCHGGNKDGYPTAGWFDPSDWVKKFWPYVGQRL